MFEHIEKLPDDPILKISKLYQEDSRPEKIDVGVGVFQDSSGKTPIMRAVKLAEQRIWQEQTTKVYVGINGSEAFNKHMTALILGRNYDHTRVRANQAVAGTGALRIIAEVLRDIAAGKRFWTPDPTWGNHHAIFGACGFGVNSYPYYDREKSIVNREAFFSALEKMGENDIVLLHGCCHNPSGADLTPEDWDKVAEIAVRRGFLPIVDLAYLGFGEGLDKDAYGVRKLASSVETLFVAASCSKNFGLYRERVGIVLTIAKNADTADALRTHLASASRAMISMAPDHGAAIVAEILADETLYAEWLKELNEVSTYIRQRRQQLAEAMDKTCGGNWRFITDSHRGMFTLLPLGKERVERLRNDYAVYMVGEGRINIAGMKSTDDVQRLAEAVKNVL
ncbi:MAG: amino acid aminotransferase [Cardiobacteriaceae bacterium]|nr:amino acid aminotransferase [Cardiobacteriaceae bacterium]